MAQSRPDGKMRGQARPGIQLWAGHDQLPAETVAARYHRSRGAITQDSNSLTSQWLGREKRVQGAPAQKPRLLMRATNEHPSPDACHNLCTVSPCGLLSHHLCVLICSLNSCNSHYQVLPQMGLKYQLIKAQVEHLPHPRHILCELPQSAGGLIFTGLHPPGCGCRTAEETARV